MGKPSSSCLKIITCGSDSAVEDEAPEAKGSGEKRGWSFRKKSTRHRVLSSSVTSENLTLGPKETSQSTTIENQTTVDTAISEKVLALEQPDEKCQPPASFELKPPKTIEPELSETSDALNPPKLLEPEVSEILNAPKQPELFEPEELERVNASESPELVDPEKCVSVGESKSLNLVEQEVHETVAASALEPSEQVEPKTSVSVGESESLNLEAKVPEAVVTSALEPPQPVESEMFDEVVAESPAITELIQSNTVASSKEDIMEEPIVIIIQTGVRGYLAQRELAKLRSTVKLQAAIRGHLVRRQAVDTLYCMQGIIKVQSLIRARQSMLLGSDVSVNKPITTESSTEKLLRSAFARQLLESTPKSKSTIIKCDPLKPNPAWTWLERWMAVSSSGLADSETPEVIAENVQFQEEEISPTMECGNLPKVKPESINPEFAVKEAYETFENEKISISSDPAEEYQPSSLLSSEEKMEQPYDSANASFVAPLEVASQNDQSIQSDPHPQTQSGTLSNNLVVEIEEPKLSTKRMASEQVDVENTKFAYGSRKASSPAFIAAQSKFEELSSSANSASLKSPRQDAIVESYPNTESSLEESVLKEKEPSKSEASITDETRVNMGGSECGTELSVTSALDSPDRFEAEVAELDLGVKYVKEEASSPISSENLDVKANGCSSVYDSNSSSSALVQKESPESNGVPTKSNVAADSNQSDQKPEAFAFEEHDNGEYVVLDMAAGSPHLEHKLESSASNSQVEVGSQVEQSAVNLSPEATPNSSRMTIAESQGTPSSQVSVKTKRSKADKSRSNTKHSSHSAGKKTAAKPLLDSGVRSSGEQLSKDQKSGKRRSSFGSAKSDNIDQEPRDSTSSIKALPSYMQATESAKAKSHSPRSSPDVQDKDANIIKKRHSLPGAVGRQGSPRVQRPTAQSPQPQAVKGNANTPPQERKWLR